MCVRCHEEAGHPEEWNDKIARAVPLIQTIYRHHCAGGLLHIVLDDWNIEDSHVQWAADYVTREKAKWQDCEPEMTAACVELAPLLVEMSEIERASALAYVDGIIPIPDSIP